MADREPITAEELRKILHYNPDTGVFTRLLCTGRGRRPQGGTAGTRRGYRVIHTCGRFYVAHRLAFLWMTGEWPRAELDHVNFDKSDNRWCNIREATHSQNAANKPIHANNASGFKGVSFHKPLRKWRVQVQANGKKRHIGYFDNPVHAAIAYRRAALAIHGEYAPKDERQ